MLYQTIFIRTHENLRNKNGINIEKIKIYIVLFVSNSHYGVVNVLTSKIDVLRIKFHVNVQVQNSRQNTTTTLYERETHIYFL